MSARAKSNRWSTLVDTGVIGDERLREEQIALRGGRV
jgi:hypothetical protein